MADIKRLTYPKMMENRNFRGYVRIRALLFAAVIALVISSCGRWHDHSLEQIRRTGKLIALTKNNANTYYTYRDEPVGFEYDLLALFADHLGVELELKTPSWDSMFDELEEGSGHLIAAGVTATDNRRERFDFSDPTMMVQQQIVVHKGRNGINGLDDLAGTSVHIRPESSYQERLHELVADGLKIDIILHPDIPTEELIREVARGELPATIADSNIALLNRRYYPDIRIAFPISEEQPVGWMVRKGDTALLKEINRFLRKIRENGQYSRIYEKYYANVHVFDYLDLKKFARRLETRLPRYRELIQREAASAGLDWRMIAAVIYQESHFNPNARSYTGVKGLMQVTLTTAKEMGITNRLDPEQSVRAGVRYLAALYDRFDDIENPRQRFLFALASYNVGYGHVRDAQQIAGEKGLPTGRWTTMQKVLPLLRNPEIYRKTRYGYCRGTEPVRYVRRVLMYFDIIRRKARQRQTTTRALVRWKKPTRFARVFDGMLSP